NRATPSDTTPKATMSAAKITTGTYADTSSSVQSQPAREYTTLVRPPCRARRTIDPLAGRGGTGSTLRPVKVLVVEDELDVGTVFRDFLIELGHEAVLARSAEAALG